MSFESRIIGSFLFWNTFVWNNFIIWNIYTQVIHHISALQHFLYHFICCTTIFFLSGFSFTDIDNSQDSRGREGTFFSHSTTSTCSRTFRQLFATLRVRWLLHIFNRTACIHQTTTWWTWARIDFHPFITSKPTNQVC